jgi:hypothetical protein
MIRDDILVSACIYDIEANGQGAEALERLAQNLGKTFRYWEILLAVPADADKTWVDTFRAVQNLRLLRLRQGIGSYQQRTVLATEAIGDIVLVAPGNELGYLDQCGMIVDSHRMNSVVIGDRGKVTVLDALLGVAGNSSGFRVNARFMQTVALPRGLLTRILGHSEPQLALRFPPRDHSIPIIMQRSGSKSPARELRQKLGGRLHLMQRLIVSASPNVLLWLSIASACTAFGGFLFMIYVILVWMFQENIQPGWVTTSAALSGSATFMGLMGLGLSTGMQKIINLLVREENDHILEEISSINIYAGISRDLNVHYERGNVPEGAAVLAPRDPAE